MYRYGAGRFCDEHLDRAHVFWALPPACRGIVGSEGGGDGCDELGSSVGTTGTTGGYVWDWSATGRRRGEPKGPPANAFEAEEESDWETEEEEDLDIADPGDAFDGQLFVCARGARVGLAAAAGGRHAAVRRQPRVCRHHDAVFVIRFFSCLSSCFCPFFLVFERV